jgi:hypothetical protein
MPSPYESEWVKLVKTLVRQDIDPETGTPFKLRELTLRGKHYVFNDKQAEFISNLNGEDKFILLSGGRGAGKSLALCVKLYVMCKGFKGIRILLGRKTMSDLDRTTLADFFKIVPPSEYEHRVKDGIINFKNGSQIVMLGLDAVASGGESSDIKKGQQKTKSMNIGSFVIDQLEEVEYQIFQSVNDTMRMTSPEMGALLTRVSDEERLAIQQMSQREILLKYDVLDYPRQGNMTCNPANFWAYHYFKLGERMNEDGVWIPKTMKDSVLIEVSMLDNSNNLPADFVKDRLNREESYVRRFVHGEWTTDVLLKGSVFAKEHIKALEAMRKTPLAIEEDCEIYEYPKPGMEYRMGVDPSEGIVDPSSISVVSMEGRKVAKFNKMVPITGLADKVKFLYYKYNKPLIVPESNSAGAALIREIRDLRVYRRKRTDRKTDEESEVLGFRMSWDTKSQLITHFQTLLRAGIPKIYDPKTTEELKTFLWSDEARQEGAGAAKGFHDDDVISTMLAFWEFHPKKIEELRVSQTRPRHKKSFQYK